jgi:hypothetical protein
MCPLLNNWLREAQITFRKVFQRDYTTIALLTSFVIYLLIHIDRVGVNVKG